MSDQTLSQALDALDPGADFSDPDLYRKVLYGDQPEAEAPAAPQGETEKPAEAAPAAAPAPESSETPAAAESPPEPQIAGALTKDGKHVIPYSVVQDLRNTTAQQAQRIAELQAAMERMQNEAKAQSEGTSTAAIQAQAEAAALEFTADELADLEAIPAAAKLVKGFQALQAKLNEIEPAVKPAAQPATPAPNNAEAVQAAIDTLPMLAKWQAKGGQLWQEAVALDAQLQSDPQWAGKPMAERFAEVQRRVADEYGVPVSTNAPGGSSAPANKAAPQEHEARQAMPTLTDFNGSTVAGDPTTGLTPGQMVDRAMNLSMEEIRRSVGLSY